MYQTDGDSSVGETSYARTGQMPSQKEKGRSADLEVLDLSFVKRGTLGRGFECDAKVSGGHRA